jgi:hypothetical protein
MPSESERFEGFCSGGPYNGMWASETVQRCVVAYDFDPSLESANPVIRYGSYRFNLGKWIWSADGATHPG